MNFSQFIAILRARWLTAVSVFMAVVVVVVGVSLLLPKKYTATAAVLVDMRSSDPIAGGSPNGLPMSYVSTQADIIQSSRVAQRVVRDLKLTESPQLRDQWMDATDGQGSFEVWLAEALQSKLDVKPSRESSVISVSFTSPDAKFSAALANAFVQSYLATTLDLRVDPAKQYSSFFDSRSKELREAVEKAQAKLTAYQRDHGIIANDERYDVETARLNELSSQLVTAQAMSVDSSSREAQARKSGSQLGDVINNPVVQGLRADLSRQEAKLREMTTRMGDNHPSVKEARANIAEMRARLAAETSRVSGSVGVDNRINQSRVGELRAALAAQRARVAQIKQQRDEAMVLQRDVESAQRDYDAVTARLTQSSLESQTKQTNTAMLAPATEPIRPSSPNVTLNSLLGVFVGVMFAIAFALLRELGDRRLRSVQDAVHVLGIPVLGHLPGPMRKPLLGRQRLVLPQQVMARLPRTARHQTARAGAEARS
ncbi:MAG: chain length determinant protein EpsF [Rhizobacter sp.]|nr:chain length determinant protein EpsF [Rhizobacter sp.]